MSEIRGLIAMAWEARRQGRHGEAERAVREAVTLARERGRRLDLVHALKAQAHVLRDVGQNDSALSLYEEALVRSREEGDDRLLAHTVRHLGDLHREAGRTSDAAACYEESLSLYQSAADPNPLDVANALRPAALLREAMGDTDGARRFWSEARRLYDAAGVREGVEECDAHLQ